MDDFPAAPSLKIVSTVPEGTEQVVAELVEMTTRRLADAYVTGFKLGVSETLRIVAESQVLDARVQEQVQQFVDQYTTPEVTDD